MIRYSASLALFAVGCSAFRVWLHYYFVGFQNIAEYRPGLDPWFMLTTAVGFWAIALGLLLRVYPCVKASHSPKS